MLCKVARHVFHRVVGFAPAETGIGARSRRQETSFLRSGQTTRSFWLRTESVACGRWTFREMDEQALSDYFSFGYIPAPKTIYRSVKKVLPGHYLVASAQGVRETCYWDLSFAKVEQRSEAEWGEMLRHEICEATRIRLMSDVPLGAFLSLVV